MAGMVFVLVLAALCVGPGLVSADDGSELKALSSRLLQLLSQESLEKRSFYNVVRVKDRTTVYFQTNSQCQGCAHSVTYWNGQGEQTMRHVKGEKAVLPFTQFGADMMIRVCEEKGNTGKNCMYAFLEANQTKTKFATSNENGL